MCAVGGGARQWARRVFDEVFAEAALRQHRLVVMVTSDAGGMTKLSGERVRLVAV